MIDSDGVLYRCYEGMCANYDPDRTKPIGVRAHNVQGLEVYECLKFELDSEQTPDNHCGGQYCLNRLLKTEE